MHQRKHCNAKLNFFSYENGNFYSWKQSTCEKISLSSVKNQRLIYKRTCIEAKIIFTLVFDISYKLTYFCLFSNLRACFFLAHTWPDDHTASEVSKNNTSGNVPKVTQLYPASDLGNGWECVEWTQGKRLLIYFQHRWCLFLINVPLLLMCYKFPPF